jgi:hydroxymethylglutaryl-CoA lyase
MVKEGVEIISLADTVGLASSEQIRFALTTLIPQYPETTIGVHLHSTAKNWEEKLSAAFESGCNRFDGVMKGIGGCPMAQDDLVGNMDSEKMIPFFQSKQLLQDLDPDALMRSSNMALQVFQ